MTITKKLPSLVRECLVCKTRFDVITKGCLIKSEAYCSNTCLMVS